MTSQRHKHTKPRRFYVPGLFSLFLLFPLAMFQLDRYRASKKSYVLEVNWYSPQLTRPHDLQFPPDRLYQVFTLNGNRKDDNIKLDFAQLAVREMLAVNDTVNGVRVHFTDTARYESLVQALDICNREGALTYVPHKNDLWIFNLKGIPILNGCIPYSHPICGTMKMTSIVNGKVAFPFRYDYDRRFWPVLLMLVVLTGLSFRRGSLGN